LIKGQGWLQGNVSLIKGQGWLQGNVSLIKGQEELAEIKRRESRGLFIAYLT
jgi:hypothetical protein